MENVEHEAVYMEKDEGGVSVIYLNQPRKKNAINQPMMDLLVNCLLKADHDPDTKAIILRGADGCFSSGGDLSQDRGEDDFHESSRRTYRSYSRAVLTMRTIAKPIIAMVDGYAIGGGLALVLASDLVYVSQTAVAIPAFCQVGLAPEMAICKMLPDLVGPQRAKEILFLGERISGTKLCELGIANRAFAPEELEASTYEIARKVAAMPSASIQVAKSMMNSLTDSNLLASLNMEQTASPFCSTGGTFGEKAKQFS